jgi:hypothetical protein
MPKPPEGQSRWAASLREAFVARLVGDAPAPQELHGARIDEVRRGERDGLVALLHQKARDSTPAELDGQPEPARPTSDDEHREV